MLSRTQHSLPCWAEHVPKCKSVANDLLFDPSREASVRAGACRGGDSQRGYPASKLALTPATLRPPCVLLSFVCRSIRMLSIQDPAKRSKEQCSLHWNRVQLPNQVSLAASEESNSNHFQSSGLAGERTERQASSKSRNETDRAAALTPVSLPTLETSDPTVL